MINVFIADTNDLSKNIKFKRDENVSQIDKKLKLSLLDWSNYYLKMKKYVIDNFASFFHYKKREYTTFSELMIN